MKEWEKDIFFFHLKIHIKFDIKFMMKGEKFMTSKKVNILQEKFIPVDGKVYDWDTLRVLSDIWDYDQEVFAHCIRTENYVRNMLEYLGKEDEELCNAALIHDIGKIYIPYDLLHKPGKLDSVERSIIDMHSYYGYLYLKDRGFSLQVCEYVLYHHGVKDEWKNMVPQESKKVSQNINILRAGDIFDALTSNRPYRKAMKKDDAIEILKEEHIEPRIITCVRETI